MARTRILLPLDGSKLAERMTVHARRLLHAPGAEAVLLHVVPTAKAAEGAWIELEAMRDRLQEAGMSCTARVVVGDAATRIVEIAQEIQASLIALSTHGRSGVVRLARGSVAEEVLRSSPVPVLVANPFALQEEHPIKTILVPLDGSKRSAEILPMAEEVARLHGAELVLLHVSDLSWCHYPDVARPHELAMARAYLDRELEQLGVRARGVVVEGPVPAKIIEAAVRERADLVALATHGRSGFARWYFGSVAEAILRRATCPLLVTNGEPRLERQDASLQIRAIAN